MKLIAQIEKTKDCWFLIATVFIFFLLRLPSLIEPYWYGDEGIYQVIGMALNQDKLLYRDIWDNKPPLLYIIYSIFYSDQFALRFVSLIFGIFTIFAFYALAKKLLQSQKSTLFSTGLFAVLFGLPLLEGNIANAENFMLLPIILAGFFVYNYTLLPKRYPLAVAGFLLSLAFLFKIVAIFDFAAFSLFLFFWCINKKIKLQKITPIIFALGLGFAAPILFTASFFLLNGIFSDFLNATFAQNIGYVGYGNTFFIPQGLLLAKLILLSTIVLYLFIKRHKFSLPQLFIFLWFSFSIFNAFFSQRPYTHYLLVLLPSFSLMIGLLFTKNKTQMYKKTMGLLLLIIMFFIATNFTFYLKIVPYYKNYLSFITNKNTLQGYQGFFDKRTPEDYAIVSFLKMHMEEKDTVFIWGNNGQVYALLRKLPPGRFIVAYHITSSLKTLEETSAILAKAKPKFIVNSHTQPIPFQLTNYKERIMIYQSHIYEREF